MGLREEHERLKAETLAAFNEAKELQARWAHIAQAQEEAYKVCRPSPIPSTAKSLSFGSGCNGIRH